MKAIIIKEEEKDITQEEKLEDKTEQGAPNMQVSETSKVQKPPVDFSQMCTEVEALLSNDKVHEQSENRRDTLKGILALLKNELTDICKKDVAQGAQGDIDTSISDATDKMDTSKVVNTENIVQYDVKLKVDSDTDDESSRIKNIVGVVVEQIVHKIDEENNEHSQESDRSALPVDKPEESDVKTDEPPVEQCPVHGTIPPNVVDTVDTAAGNVFYSGQPPGYVKEVETVLLPVYVNNGTVDTGEKCK